MRTVSRRAWPRRSATKDEVGAAAETGREQCSNHANAPPVARGQVDPHRKRGHALRSGSDAAADLTSCIRCNYPALDATGSTATL